jgi:hypothetical protein
MKQLKKYLIIGALSVLLLGTLCHFFYEWSGSNPVIGLFCPVNESTWEHMKLVFFPMLLVSFFIIPRFKEMYPCITVSFYSGLLIGTFLVPVLFYTYIGILGFDVFFLDLLTFIISVLAGFYAAYRFTLTCKISNHCLLLLQSLVWILCLCFIVFSYFPPALGLFAIPSQASNSFLP